MHVYITIKKFDDSENVNSVNPFYLIFGKADGYIDKNSGNKYLDFTSTDCNKNVLAKFSKLWDQINIWLKQWMEVKKWVWKTCHENKI